MMSALVPGSQVGRYRLEAEIGRGGMGVVYRALDLSLNRLAALKVLAPHLGNNDSALRRFHREAASAANLRHPHIAIAYEYGEHAGQPYIAFEWIEGRSLKDILAAEGKLPLDRALRLFDQLASALDYAHQRGVVHRDIKPANILVSPADEATIVDFGLAWLASAPAITLSGDIFGTPQYMSPEQIQGDPLDGRSDLYSLAVTLYEMLAGRPPFKDSIPTALLHSHIYKTPPPITSVNPALPLAVERALARALAKRPDERFATAAELGSALRAAGGPPPLESPAPAPEPAAPSQPQSPAPTPTVLAASNASPTDPPRPAPLRSKRPGWFVWGGLAGLAGLCLCALISLPSLLSPGLEPTAAQAASETAAASATAALTLLPPITDSFSTDVAVFTLAPGETMPAEATPPEAAPTITLTPITPVPYALPLTEGVWPLPAGDSAHTGFVYEGLPPLHPVPRWNRNPQAQAATTGIVAGQGLVVLGVDNRVRAFDWNTGQPVWDVAVEGNVIGAPALLVFEGGGIVYAVTDAQYLYALNLADGAVGWAKPPEEMLGTVYGGAVISPDGALYAVTDTGWVHAFNPLTAEVYYSLDLTQTDLFYTPPAITLSHIYLAGFGQTIYAIDRATLETVWQAAIFGSPVTPPVVSEAAGVLFVGTDRSQIEALYLDGSPAWSVQTSGPVAGLSTDNVRLYAAVRDGNVHGLDVYGGTGWVFNTGLELNTPPLNDGVSVMVPASNGDVLYIDAASGQELADRRLSTGEGILGPPAFAGQWLFLRAWQVYGFGP